MVMSAYRYVIELRRADGTWAGQAALAVDWDAADESAKFAALRRGRLRTGGGRGGTSAEPIWHPTLGAPFVSGVRLAVQMDGADPVATDVTTAYFQAQAHEAASQLVEEGALQTGEPVFFFAAAFPSVNPASAPAPASTIFSAVDAAPRLPVPEASLADVERDAVLVGTADADDVPVFVPQSVLEEAARLAREAGSSETGGILIGHVHRDGGGTDLFVRVTTQLPARYTETSATRLTFTSATWTDARAALALRRKGEIMVGWWHSHPIRHWCKDCPVERQRACHLARDFFSEHDRALHRAVFGAAFSVALVVNDGTGDPTFSLFGWRRGLIESRGFGVTGGSRSAAPVELDARDGRQECEPCSQREAAPPTLVPSSIG